jgi:hypothetical protein
VKFDADRAGAVRFHTISVPIPADAKNRDKVVQLLGDKLEVVVGIGAENVYVSAGRNALGTLKQAIKTSAAVKSRPTSPVAISVAFEPIARTIAAVGEEKDRPAAQIMATELKKAEGMDHVRLVAKSVPQGIQYRLELEPGVVRVIGHMATLKQQAAQGGY